MHISKVLIDHYLAKTIVSAGLFFVFLTSAAGQALDYADAVRTSSRDLTLAKSKTIRWDTGSLVKIAGPPARHAFAGYARLIELDNRELICVYEAAGSIWQVKSTDSGKSWADARIIAGQEKGIHMAVPEILQLANQDLLLMYNPRPHEMDSARRFGIRIAISHDRGKTWGSFREVYTAGYQFENGCWEPAAIQLPDGSIQLYFANEGIYTASDEQDISMIRSTDNGSSWSASPRMISFRSGKRDGMPVPLLLRGNRRIAVAIEDNGLGNFKPFIITNTLDENWAKTVRADSPNRYYALSEPLGDSVYAGAPYLRQLSTGETILSFQSTEGRPGNKLKNAVMNVMIGDSLARGFAGRTLPFQVPFGKSGLWNSLAVLSDDTIIAVTSTNAYSAGASEIWMIKGRLVSD